jgi:mannose-6-phosphate isomerase-like protein (cupin superfamily)
MISVANNSGYRLILGQLNLFSKIDPDAFVSMKESIKSLDLRKELYTDEACYIAEVSNSSDDPQLSIARARVKPGVTTRWHRLINTHERYCIISGEAIVEIGILAAQKIVAGDVVLIPPMCRQRIRNTGTKDLIFFAICTPRFSSDNYQDLEQGPHL